MAIREVGISKWCNKDTKPSEDFIKFEGVELYTDIHEGGIFEPSSSVEDILDLWKWILELFCNFIELPKVADELTRPIWFWNYKGWRSPFSGIAALEDAKFHLLINFLLHSLLLVEWDWIWLFHMEWRYILLELNVELLIRKNA